MRRIKKDDLSSWFVLLCNCWCWSNNFSVWDVCALYPSSTARLAEEAARLAILETDVTFSGIDYRELAKYVAMNTSEYEVSQLTVNRNTYKHKNFEAMPLVVSVCAQDRGQCLTETIPGRGPRATEQTLVWVAPVTQPIFGSVLELHILASDYSGWLQVSLRSVSGRSQGSLRSVLG